MVSRVDVVLGMQLNSDDGDDVTFASDVGVGNPYLQYNTDPASAGNDGATQAGNEKRSKSASKRASATNGASNSSNGNTSYNHHQMLITTIRKNR